MRRRLFRGVPKAFVVASVLALSALPAAGQRSTTSPAPSYLAGHGDRFELPSNGRLTNARELVVTGTNGNLNKPAGKGEPYAQIWAKKCPHDGQSVSFRRTIDIPGPPSAAQFQIQPAITGPIPTKVLRGYKLLINGETAAKGGPFRTSSNRLTKLDAARRALLRNGPNLVEVRLTRGELPKGMRRCNSDAQKNGLGVFFLLSGEFAADMALADQPPPQYYKAQSPYRGAFLNLSFRNDGPSAILEGGVFVVTVSGATNAVLIGEPPKPPFASCTRSGSIVFTCELTRLAPGERGVLRIGIQKDFESTAFTETHTSVRWRVNSSTPDTDLSDNDRNLQITWCGTQSAKPECASAS